jgi:hypothetical protein
MLRALFHRTIAKLERDYRYDATYLHEIAEASPAAFMKFGMFSAMSSHHQSVLKEAWFAARIAAAYSEDCGPCTQLVVDMALKAKVSPLAIAALLRGEFDEAGKDASLGFRYGVAVSRNDPEAVTLAEEAERRYGKRGLVSLAFAVAASRVYPTLKRGLGHGAACTKIRVSNDTIEVKRAA